KSQNSKGFHSKYHKIPAISTYFPTKFLHIRPSEVKNCADATGSVGVSPAVDSPKCVDALCHSQNQFIRYEKRDKWAFSPFKKRNKSES
ncbi:MAG: hypothetical protein PUD56_04730, partial [Prevotella sp.]|nr:hypothetical protein [Prevotella sp.]